MPSFLEKFSWPKKTTPELATNLPEGEITPETKNEETTPNRLIKYGELVINSLCKNYETQGFDELKNFKNEHQADKFVITGSHMNNLDVPAALKTLGPEFNLQVTGNELFEKKIKYLAQNIGVNTLFHDRFTTLGQKAEDKIEEGPDGKKKKVTIESGVFRPENFTELDKQMEKGRTLWMATHSFSEEGKMRQVDNGALIEAYRQNAWVIPTALELTSGSKNMQGVKEIAKNLKDSGAVYHIGKPYKPEALPEGYDINILTDVVNKRKSGEEVSPAEFEAFKNVHHFLSEQTEKLGKIISDMLPEEQRGFYQKL